MLKDIAPKGRASAVKNPRRLRRSMSLPEVILWQALRRHSGELKFRRQHLCGPYILDFFCGDARLAIEVDGEAHDRDDRPRRDEARDSWLAEVGVRTLRIPASAVLADANAVIEWVNAEALSALPLHHPARPDGPPPRAKLEEEL